MLVKISLNLIYIRLKRSLWGFSNICGTLKKKKKRWLELKFIVFFRAQKLINQCSKLPLCCAINAYIHEIKIRIYAPNPSSFIYNSIIRFIYLLPPASHPEITHRAGGCCGMPWAQRGAGRPSSSARLIPDRSPKTQPQPVLLGAKPRGLML